MTGKIDSELCNLDYEETIKLVVESSELSMRAACAVATLPVRCYIKALTCWTSAVTEAWEKSCANPGSGDGDDSESQNTGG